VQVDVLGERFPAVLAAAVDGDPVAFAELWRATHPPLLRYLRVLCGADAEDIASETWLKVMRGLGTFAGDEPAFRAWLTVVARNHARDVARKAARRPEVLTDEAPPPPASAGAPDAADLALERLGTEQALKLLATLPPAQAEMVALRVVVGLEPVEVARIVGRSAGAVRVAVHRGLATLAAQLGGRKVIDLRGGETTVSDVTQADVTTGDQQTFTRRHG
jgi:RNA polymerase sigma-70 factor (ECF subfamily)